MPYIPNRGVAGVVGPVGLALELFRIVSVLRWTRCRDDLIQFFLMVELFNTHANVNTPEAKAKYNSYKKQVEKYLQTVDEIKETNTEEEAVRFMEAARDQMKVVMEHLGLDVRTDSRIRRHWNQAEGAKAKFKQISSPTSATTTTQGGPLICLNVSISDGSQELKIVETRKLAFSKLFENWCLSTLLSYTLANPGKLGQVKSSSKEPIKRQAMDSIYLRSINSDNEVRTWWTPIDYDDRKTVKQCVKEIGDKPRTQIWFISCKTRFVLVAAYDEHKNSVVEKIVDLDKQGKQLLEVLKHRDLLDIASSTALESVKGKGKGKGKGKERAHERTQHESGVVKVKFDTNAAFKTLEPRSCLLLLGPDPFSITSPA